VSTDGMLYGGYQPKFRPSKQCYILHFFFLNEKSVNKCKDSLDSFDKDLIRRVVLVIRKLRVTLEKNHSLKLSKYKLWKTLHELRFLDMQK
jgi:hypothetical protein